jgi:hypothetical protein
MLMLNCVVNQYCRLRILDILSMVMDASKDNSLFLQDTHNLVSFHLGFVLSIVQIAFSSSERMQNVRLTAIEMGLLLISH